MSLQSDDHHHFRRRRNAARAGRQSSLLHRVISGLRLKAVRLKTIEVPHGPGAVPEDVQAPIFDGLDGSAIRLLKLGITGIFLFYTTLVLQQHRSSERAAGAHHRQMTRDIAEWNRIVRKGRERVQWQAEPVDWMTGEMGR